MAIVKMKRIRLIALNQDRDALLADLLHVGCVEIREPEDSLSESDSALLHRETSALASARNGQPQLHPAI